MFLQILFGDSKLSLHVCPSYTHSFFTTRSSVSQGFQGNKTRSYPSSVFSDTQRPVCRDFTYDCIFGPVAICFMVITKMQMCHQGFEVLCVFYDFNGIFNPCFRQCFLFAKIQGGECEVGGILCSNGPISKSIIRNPDQDWLERSLTGGDVPNTYHREEPSDSPSSIFMPN